MNFISLLTIILSFFTYSLVGSDFFAQEIEQYIAPSNGIVPQASPVRPEPSKKIPAGIRHLRELEELRRSKEFYTECYEDIAAEIAQTHSPLQKRTDVKNKFILTEEPEKE